MWRVQQTRTPEQKDCWRREGDVGRERWVIRISVIPELFFRGGIILFAGSFVHKLALFARCLSYAFWGDFAIGEAETWGTGCQRRLQMDAAMQLSIEQLFTARFQLVHGFTPGGLGKKSDLVFSSFLKNRMYSDRSLSVARMRTRENMERLFPGGKNLSLGRRVSFPPGEHLAISFFPERKCECPGQEKPPPGEHLFPVPPPPGEHVHPRA